MGFEGEGGEGVEGRGLLRGRGGGEQGFGVFGEEGGAVGGVEAFGEDDQGGARAGGFEDVVSRPGEVEGFVGACEYVGRGDGVSLKGTEGDMGIGMEEGEIWSLPVASWISASFNGFLRRLAIVSEGTLSENYSKD